jgi:hypothetical protein
LWNTESGFFAETDDGSLAGTSKKLTHLLSAYLMSQTLILGASLDLKRFYYYSWDHDKSGMVTSTGELLPAYFAYEKVQKWLIGAKMTGCESLAGNVTACNGNKDKRTFIIFWSESPQPKVVLISKGLSISGQESLVGESTTLYKVVGGKVVVTSSQAPTLLWFN